MTTIAPALCPMELRPLGDCPLVSVLMPLHNYEQFVASAISSVLEQTYRNFELMLEWKIPPNGDSGVLLPGGQQVQIWAKDSGPEHFFNCGV